MSTPNKPATERIAQIKKEIWSQYPWKPEELNLAAITQYLDELATGYQPPPPPPETIVILPMKDRNGKIVALNYTAWERTGFALDAAPEIVPGLTPAYGSSFLIYEAESKKLVGTMTQIVSDHQHFIERAQRAGFITPMQEAYAEYIVGGRV